MQELKEITIQMVFDGLTEDQKINVLVNEMKLCNMQKLSFKIGEEFGVDPLRRWDILHGYFTSLLDSYKKEDPEVKRFFWPETGYNDLDKSFQTIMEGYSYTVKKCQCTFYFGDWGELDNKSPYGTEYPCAYKLNYKDYRFEEGDGERGISEGFLAVHPTYEKDIPVLGVISENLCDNCNCNFPNNAVTNGMCLTCFNWKCAGRSGMLEKRARRNSLTNIPGVISLPSLPSYIPRDESVLSMPRQTVPTVPSVPNLTRVPTVPPTVPSVPNVPVVPTNPNDNTIRVVPIDGQSNMYRDVEHGFILRQDTDGFIVAVYVEENGVSRALTPNEKETAQLRGLNVFD